MRLRRVVVSVGIVAGVVLAMPGAASAHPLGNFTVNQASAFVVGRDRVSVEHVVDFAEIPTFQARSDIDSNHDGNQSATERRAWAGTECGRVVRALDLTVDGSRAVLGVDRSRLTILAGQAGLPTLRLQCSLAAKLPATAATHTLAFVNHYDSSRIGWREITAVGDGATLVGSKVATVSPSALLTKYPTDQLSSPLDQRSVRLTSRAGGAAASVKAKHLVVPTATGSVVRGFDDLTQSLTSSVSARRLTLGLALVALAIALGLGALHAFAPGHGKTVMAAYLVGERGTLKDGLLIGVTVATTHTLGVLLLGGILTASQTFAPESVYPYLSFASGICFAGLGIALFVGALRRKRSGIFRFGHHHHGPGGHTHDHAAHDHADHGPAAHDHAAHDHGTHDHAAHDHAPAPPDDARQLSRKNLLTLGFAGGLVPTPTAVVVLLGATALGRAWFGAVLVVAYGIGMGATLVLAGLVLAKARKRFDLTGRSERAMRIAAIFPVVTAAVITTSGLWLVARAAIAL